MWKLHTVSSTSYKSRGECPAMRVELAFSSLGSWEACRAFRCLAGAKVPSTISPQWCWVIVSIEQTPGTRGIVVLPRAAFAVP